MRIHQISTKIRATEGNIKNAETHLMMAGWLPAETPKGSWEAAYKGG